MLACRLYPIEVLVYAAWFWSYFILFTLSSSKYRDLMHKVSVASMVLLVFTHSCSLLGGHLYIFAGLVYSGLSLHNQSFWIAISPLVVAPTSSS